MNLTHLSKSNFFKTCIIVFLFLPHGVYSQDLEPASTTPLWNTRWNNSDVTFEDIQRDFNAYWEGRENESKKGTGYKQYKRWENFMKPRVYPSGDMTLPSTNYHNYMEWRKNRPASARTNSSANWIELGPNSKPGGDDSGVGRLNMVRFHPTSTDTMFAGAADGGLWKTTNAGASWSTNTDFLPIIGVADLVIDPTTTTTMYLATGDVESDRRSIGVLKSIDNGTTWNTTGLSWTATDNYRISKMLMHPSNSAIILVSTSKGVFRTTDSGATWTNYLSSKVFNDMEFKPGDPNTVYVSGTEIWKSTDNGINWTQTTTGVPTSNVVRIVLGVTADDDSYVYAIAGRADNNSCLGVYRSTDSGGSFTTQFTPANTMASPNILGSNPDGTSTTGQANYDLALTVSPADKDFITVGGINQWQSSDGGTSWYIISHWKPNTGYEFVHADIHEIVYMPGNNTTMFTCCDGGLYKSTDDGATWSDLSNNISVTQQNALGSSATNANKYVSGLQDIGSIYNSSGSSTGWQVVGGGDGEDCFIDWNNDDNILISYPTGYLELSTDGGATFNGITTGLPDGDFFCPTRQDPTVASRYYAGGRPNLYVSNDNGSTFTTTGDMPFGGDNATEFVIAPSDNTIIYAILFDGVAKSTDSGATWNYVTTNLPTGSAELSNITISNVDADKVWVTYSGYDASTKVYKTINGGTSWTNLSTGLPNLPVNTIVFQNGSASEILYIGMDIGVYVIDNTISSWIPYSTDLPNVKVSNLRIFYNSPNSKLRAATYGRGSWESDLTTGPLPIELISFTGENRNDDNLLFWSTAMEENLDYYSIERSSDGEDFETIGMVTPVSINSSDRRDYEFKDSNPVKGINYYRLKIMDIDSKFEYSKVLVIFVDDKSNISIFPNPTTTFLNINGVGSKKIRINIMNAQGRFVRSQELFQGEQINVSNFPNGTYFIEVLTEGEKFTKRFIKH